MKALTQRQTQIKALLDTNATRLAIQIALGISRENLQVQLCHMRKLGCEIPRLRPYDTWRMAENAIGRAA